jgi:hypothetical protein
LSIGPNGNVYLIGTVSDTTYSNGGSDFLMAGLTINGNTLFVTSFGGIDDDTPAGIVYNPK